MLEFILKDIKGSGKSLGLTDGVHTAGLGTISTNAVAARQPLFDANVGTTTSSTATLTTLAAIGITTDSTKSGIISNTSSTVKYAIKY